MSLLNQTILYIRNESETISKVVDLEENCLVLENNERILKEMAFPFPSDTSTDHHFIQNLPHNYNFQNPDRSLFFLHPKGMFQLTINFQRTFSTLNSFTPAQKKYISIKFHKFVYELIDSLQFCEEQEDVKIYKSTIFKCFVVVSPQTNTLISIKSKTPTYFKLRKKHASPTSSLEALKENASNPIIQNKIDFIIRSLEALNFTHAKSSNTKNMLTLANLRIVIQISASQDLKLILEFRKDRRILSYKHIPYSQISSLQNTISQFRSECENDETFEINHEENKALFPKVLEALVEAGFKLSQMSDRQALLLFEKHRIEVNMNKRGVCVDAFGITENITDLSQIQPLIKTHQSLIRKETTISSALELKVADHPAIRVIEQIKALKYEISEISQAGTISFVKNNYKLRIFPGDKLGFDVLNQSKMGQVEIRRIKNVPFFISELESRNQSDKCCPKVLLKELNLNGWR